MQSEFTAKTLIVDIHFFRHNARINDIRYSNNESILATGASPCL